MSRLQASRHVAARVLAPSSEALDTPLGPPRSLAVPGVCYSALRCLPRRDLHPLETNSVKQTLTSASSRRERGRSYPRPCRRTAWLQVGPPFKPCVRISRTRLPSGRSSRRITRTPNTEPAVTPFRGGQPSRHGPLGVEATVRGPLGRDPQSTLQLAHFGDGRRPIGGVGTGLAGHALTRPCAADMTTAGALPSCRVLPHGAQQYYGPL